MAAPSAPAKRRGRPLLQADRRLSIQVTIRLDVRDYDAVSADAKVRRESIATLLRKAISRHRAQ